MFSWSATEVSPAQRWGALYVFLALGVELKVRQVPDLTEFVLDVLGILTAAFLGPAVVHAVSWWRGLEWDGLVLGLLTLLSCGVVTVAVAGILRAFI